jgi:hypothetical protein
VLRWFSRLQVATACFACSPPKLNFSDPYFIFMYMHYNHCHRATAHLQLNIYYIYTYNNGTTRGFKTATLTRTYSAGTSQTNNSIKDTTIITDRYVSYVSYFIDTFINTAYCMSRARGSQSAVYSVAHQVTGTLIPPSTLHYRFNFIMHNSILWFN